MHLLGEAVITLARGRASFAIPTIIARPPRDWVRRSIEFLRYRLGATRVLQHHTGDRGSLFE